MLLAIDIGNTNIVIGVIKEDEIVFKARIATDHFTDTCMDRIKDRRNHRSNDTIINI